MKLISIAVSPFNYFSPMPFVYYQTFGCQMNIADSGELATSLALRGYRSIDDPHDADLIVVNTCSVREHAESRAKARIREYASIKRSRPGSHLWVIGCMAERLGEKLKKEIPGIDCVIGALQLADAEHVVSQYLDNKYDTSEPVEHAVGISEFVSIMRGCNNYCAYCIVPHVRGRESSIASNSIIDSIKKRVDAGLKEVTLLGQNVNSYNDSGLDFADLLKKVAAIEGLARVRFTTSHPKDCTEKLVRTIAETPKLCRHIHLPVQAGSDRILKLMNRGYSAAQYLRLIDLIRKYLPDADITTDLLVGFPSETGEEFSATFELARAVRYTTAFMFAYSVREGTAAASLQDNVPREEKLARLNRLIALQTSITKQHYESMIGKELEVMLYALQTKNGQCLMKAQDFGCKRVLTSCTDLKAGTILKVVPCRSSGMTLIVEGAFQ